MNFKKRFEKRIEEDKKSMLNESDMAYLSTLQNMVAEHPEGEVIAKPFNYKPLIISVACFLTAALTAFLIFYYTLFSKPDDIFYFKDNFVTVDSDVEELNSDLILFSFEADKAKYSVDVFKVYDSVSEDTLYYVLEINNATQDFSLKVRLEIVVNKNYTHPDMEYRKETIQSSISVYTLTYMQDIISMSVPGLYTVDCMGEMQIGTQWIYVTRYQEISLAEGTFIETLQSMIHFK